MKLTADHVQVASGPRTASIVENLWGDHVWQEDSEIAFVELAEEGIPDEFKDENGVPLDKPQVNQYLKDLYKKNSEHMLQGFSDQFFHVFE